MHISIFQTIVCCGNEACNPIIDGGSDLNLMVEATVARLKLSTESHPQP